MKFIIFLGHMAFALQSYALSYHLITSQAKVKWTGKKVTGSHWGRVDFVEGMIEFKEDRLSGGHFTIDMNTINSLDLMGESKANLDNHLKSKDFFDVDNHKNAKFVITNAEKKEGNTYKVDGKMTIRGQTHDESFNVIITKEANNKMKGKGKLVFNRTKYGIKYNSGRFFQDLGDKLIYDDIEFEFDLIGEQRVKKDM